MTREPPPVRWVPATRRSNHRIQVARRPPLQQGEPVRQAGLEVVRLSEAPPPGSGEFDKPPRAANLSHPITLTAPGAQKPTQPAYPAPRSVAPSAARHRSGCPRGKDTDWRKPGGGSIDCLVGHRRLGFCFRLGFWLRLALCSRLSRGAVFDPLAIAKHRAPPAGFAVTL